MSIIRNLLCCYRFKLLFSHKTRNNENVYEKWELSKTKPQELDTKMSNFFRIEELEGYMHILVIAGGRMSHKFWLLRSNLT